MLPSVVLLAFTFCYVLYSNGSNDLYSILGIKRSATVIEIKRAYRQKAKDTHPDKNPGVDPDIAAERFRKVADAYEILSDVNARRNYDRTGSTGYNNQGFNGNNYNNQNNRRSGSGFWDFHSNFNQYRQQRQQQRTGHKYLYDMYLRIQIKDAQSRLLTISSLSHLKFISLDENDFTDRYVLLALYDSSIPGCEEHLNLEILFPFPYAGYTNQGDKNSVSNVWWDEILLPVKMDIRGKSKEVEEVKRFFNRPVSMVADRDPRKCVHVAFIQRGAPLSEYVTEIVPTHEAFQKFVWSNLRMKITFANRSPHLIDMWWLDGLRGKSLGQLKPGHAYAADTFLTHSFYFRAAQVPGNILTNESALYWYTARNMNDDGTTIDIEDRCFDLHGDCARWKKEGFCDDHIETRFTRVNPGHRQYCRKNCFVSCQVGCGNPNSAYSNRQEL